MSRKKESVSSVLIFLISALFILMFSGFESEAYLFDDNRVQWYPVIEKAYEQFFSEGKLPAYNFYLAKGLPIAEPGYYGILNPFMMIAYLIERLSFGMTNTIAVYIAIMTGLGCVVIHKVCNQLNVSDKISYIAIAGMLSCGAYVSYYIWHYIFNNILFVPLLIWAFLKFKDTKAEFFACGIVLALDIFCGNVQYTFYHYMLYCIMSLVMILSKHKNSFKAAVSNVFIGIALSLPVFMMLLNASSDFGGDKFLQRPLKFVFLIIYACIPDGILRKLSLNISFPNSSTMAREDIFIYFSAALLVPMIICSVPLAVKLFKAIKKNGVKKFSYDVSKKSVDFFADRTKSTIFALVLGVIVFLNICDGSFIAIFLSLVPVVNHFRYLFKAYFVIVPVIAVLMAVLLEKTKGKRRTVAVYVCLICIFVGFVNNFFVYDKVKNYFIVDDQKTISEEKEYAENMIADNNMDLKNYRSICLYFNPIASKDKFDVSKNLSRNFPAYIETFSLSAYEISLSEDTKEQFGMIYAPYSFMTNYGNAAAINYFYYNLILEPEKTEKQLIDNGVKYIFLQKRRDRGIEEDEEYEEKLKTENPYEYVTQFQDYPQRVIDELNSLDNISVEKTKTLNEDYDLIVLSGVDSLCTDNNGNRIELTDERMDCLSFDVNGAESYVLQMSHNDKLFADYISNSGEKKTLELLADENGNTIISAKGLTDGKIYVGYSEPVLIVGIICETVLVAALILLLILAVKMKNKETTDAKK